MAQTTVGATSPEDRSKFEFINQVWEKATSLAKLPKNATAIPVPKFCQAYLSCLNIPFTDVDLACLVVIFSDHGEQEEQLPLVTKRQFDLFLLRFGPPNKSLQKINNVLVNGKVWFHGAQGREASERLLREKPKEGLFLLRYSSVPGSFTVDYIKKQKICRFNNIRNDPHGGVEVVVGKPPKQQAYKYSTMDTFISKNAHIFQRPALNARSHFQWLKLRIPSTTSTTRPVGEAKSESSESSDSDNAIPSGTPEERVSQAIQQSYKTDKTVLVLRGFGLGPTLPSQVCVMKFLIKLDLSKNKLNSIPPRLAALKDLENLNLSDNQLAEIPGAVFQGLTRLTHFSCSENQLVDLPLELFELHTLLNLELSANKIQRIPAHISKLTQLQFLDVSSNQIENLPPLLALENIEELLISGNKLQRIPGAWANLPNLIVLDVSSNLITAVPDEIINRIKQDPSFSFDVSSNKLSSQELGKIKSSQESRQQQQPEENEPQGLLDIIKIGPDLTSAASKPENSGIPAEEEPSSRVRTSSVDGAPEPIKESLWLPSSGYRLELGEPGKVYDPNELTLIEHINKKDYRRYFFRSSVHANVIGDEPQLGPVCVSIQKEPTIAEDTTVTAGGQLAGAFSSSRMFYRVLIRSKQSDRTLEIPANWVKLRKREKYARSDDLLAALKKMLKPTFSTKNLYVIRDKRSHDVFADLESKLISKGSKFGVMYALDGQNETDMYNNRTGSKQFEDFLDVISEKIQMLGWTGYRGDLSSKAEQWSRYTKLKMGPETHEIMFHVCTYLRYMEVTDVNRQQWERKRFIGNDIGVLVYYEGGTKPIDPSTFVSNFNHVFGLVQPVQMGGKTFYRLHMSYKDGVADSQPRLPEDGIWPKEQFKNVLLTKMVNAERCAMSAPAFRKAQEKVRAELFADLQQKFPKRAVRRGDSQEVANSCYMSPEDAEALQSTLAKNKKLK